MVKALLLNEGRNPSASFGAWCAEWGADSILIANDLTANDELLMLSMRMAAPPDIYIAFKEMDAARGLIRHESRDKDLIVVVQTRKDFDRLREALPAELPGGLEMSR